ncbi:histone H1 [Paludibacter sp. 221]|uniref:histone H1 n=1 Tax=Paludibacter sp. 221 TaxID=2302939 RepID=UPI0013CF5B37|nr:histone H1 [Paludibacter sp. 221]NDV47332.1 histone H1 [Paludibacter sp. 221]
MKNLVGQLKTDLDAFFKDAEAQIEKGNKAAGTRARKASLEIEKALKAFRKKSLESSKN